ncbi:hypothetical protein L0F63_003596 [Massospora cicadina]|nr:hypothetical protein L0F63_003596 [Massospora cicadina]
MSLILTAAQKARLGLFAVAHRATEGLSASFETLKSTLATSIITSIWFGERLTKEFPSPSDLNLARKRNKLNVQVTQSFYRLKSGYRPARNPVVLCHGFDNLPFLQVHYWQGVAEALRKLGAQVVVPRVASTGSIALRARQLHEIIERTLPGQDVNLIGHSMGGLDGRYLITHIKDKSYRVASLTTVSTPHRGSPFMDWCRDRLKVGQIRSEEAIEDRKERQDWFERLMRLLDAPAYSHLTTDFCNTKFNPSTPDSPDVAYYSYNAYLDSMHWFSILHFPWSIIKEKAGRNDGLVALESARWGQLIETVKANHFDLVSRFRVLTTLGRMLGYEDGRYTASPPLPLPRALLLSPESDFDNVEFYLRMSTFLNSRASAPKWGTVPSQNAPPIA